MVGSRVYVKSHRWFRVIYRPEVAAGATLAAPDHHRRMLMEPHMENTVPHYIQMLDPAMLLPLVRQATSDEIIQVTDWQYHQLHGGTQGGVYRVSGTARSMTTSVPWSLILKRPPTTPNLGDPFGGTREPVVYRSGFLQQLPGMLRAPRCFGVVEQPAGGH